MVAVFNKELLSWYLITLKLKETVETNLKSNPNSPSTTTYQPESVSLLHGKNTDSIATLLLPPPPPPPLPPSSSSPPPPEPEWVVAIRDRLEEAMRDDQACPWARLSIYRVPKTLREGDVRAYVPQLVSIGPFHRGKWRLREMEKHKWRALHHVLRRTGHDVRAYLDSLREVLEKAMACYEGRITIATDDFLECMVVDGCFVLEVFRGAAVEGFKELGYSRYDPIFAMRGSMHAIRQDMIMLENQLPLFLLDRLLALQLGLPPDRRGLVAPIALRFFDPLMPNDEPFVASHHRKILPQSSEPTDTFDPLSDDGLHCLDVFRRSLLVKKEPQPIPRIWIKRWSHNHRVADRRRQQLIHCVTELRNAGIKFKRRNTDRFWDVKFSAGVLKIPRLFIHDGSKSLFLNLIAFEQCHMDITNNITSYVIFMDNLINSGEDVAYLHYCGIIEHWLGNDNEVADLFNKLCQDVVFDFNDSYLSGLSDKVNRYYNHRWNTWRASLKHNYFGNPWAIISFVAAVLLLLLTAAQTFYSVYAYYLPLN